MKANEELRTLKKKLSASEEYTTKLLKEIEQEKIVKNTAETNPNYYDQRSATVVKKINTVRPLTRPNDIFPILENNFEQTTFSLGNTRSSQSEEQLNRVDVTQLELQCKNLEEQLDQVKCQIVKIVSDRNVITKENAVLKNYQIAFDSLTEQNELLIQKLNENTKMLDISSNVPDTDRTSPDGQEIDKVPSSSKSIIEYEAELERLHEKIKDLEKFQKVDTSTSKVIDLEERNKQLEESMDLIREEFESMEDYWQKKLDEERVFYEEQLKISERQFKELESRMKDYTDSFDDNNVALKSKEDDDDKLSTIEETFSLECQVKYNFDE